MGWSTASAEEVGIHTCTCVYTQADMLHASTHGYVRTAGAKSVLGQGPDDVSAERSSGLPEECDLSPPHCSRPSARPHSLPDPHQVLKK